MCKDQPRDPVTGQFLKGGKAPKPFTKENAAEMARRAAPVRARNRQGRELLRTLLSMPIKDPVIMNRLKELGYDADYLYNEAACHLRIIERVLKKGDPNAYRELMKAAGVYDGDTVNVNIQGNEDGAPVIVFREEK